MWSDPKRACLVLLCLGAGCVFTPRPMIPLTDDGGAFTGGVASDAGRISEADAGAAVPGADAAAPWVDAATTADAPGPFDFQCRPASDAGDAGYVNADGDPCDPTANAGDAGADASADAACDAPHDAADAGARDGSCDGSAATGVAQVRR